MKIWKTAKRADRHVNSPVAMIASERLLNDEHVTLPRGTQGINEAAVSGRQTIHNFCSEGVK